MDFAYTPELMDAALWDMVWRPANALRVCTTGSGSATCCPDHGASAATLRGHRAAPARTRSMLDDPRDARPAAAGCVDGEKWFVTVGDVADFLIVSPTPRARRRLFLVDKDTPGVRVSGVPRYMHTFVYEHPEFTLRRTSGRPTSRCSASSGRGYELTREWFVEERLMIAARAIGAAERALELALDWAVRARAVRPADRRLPG